MQLFKKRDIFEVLEELLIKERIAILAGDFDALGQLMAEKERFASVTEIPKSNDRLAQVKRMADRNQVLLLAASEGIRTVTRLLARNKDSSLFQTYSETGQRQGREHSPHNLTRRV